MVLTSTAVQATGRGSPSRQALQAAFAGVDGEEAAGARRYPGPPELGAPRRRGTGASVCAAEPARPSHRARFVRLAETAGDQRAPLAVLQVAFEPLLAFQVAFQVAFQPHARAPPPRASPA